MRLRGSCPSRKALKATLKVRDLRLRGGMLTMSRRTSPFTMRRVVCHGIDMPIVHEDGARIDGEKAPRQEQVEPEPRRGVEFADFIRLHHFLPRFHVGFWCAARHRLGGLLQS